MTNTKTTASQTPPIYVTITPLGQRVFEVIAMDEDMIRVVPADGQGEAQWVCTTYVRPYN